MLFNIYSLACCKLQFLLRNELLWAITGFANVQNVSKIIIALMFILSKFNFNNILNVKV